VTFEVEDTGMGILEQDQARIFDAFAQVGNPRTRKGTGLGLTITQQFIELMGGTIRVESAPGLGSRFIVELPLERTEESEAETAESEGRHIIGVEPGGMEYRILIVEDERANWELLQRLLENSGFQLRIAENGEQGVEMFQTWRPHFIWMDLRMPVMDGREATRRIRRMEGGQAVKIAAATASSFSSERDEVLAEGMDDFIRKPYRPEEIFECMARHLGLRRIYHKPEAEQRAVPLGKEDLKALPPEMLRELTAAVTALNGKQIREVIERISERDENLGRKLTHHADRFAYTAILTATEEAINAAPSV
jgi:CheY-like chemotaxis protein